MIALISTQPGDVFVSGPRPLAVSRILRHSFVHASALKHLLDISIEHRPAYDLCIPLLLTRFLSAFLFHLLRITPPSFHPFYSLCFCCYPPHLLRLLPLLVLIHLSPPFHYFPNSYHHMIILSLLPSFSPSYSPLVSFSFFPRPLLACKSS